MKPAAAVLSLSALAGFLPGASAAPEGINNNDYLVQHLRRALPDAPQGYAPVPVDCPPNRPSVRSADKLSPNETQWLQKRRGKTTDALKDFFGHVEIPGFDTAAYVDKVSGNSSSADAPNIGIAVSGGGYRALMNGAGAIKAFDSRTPNSTNNGQLGGLLQSATYLSGLSGGGWLVGSIYLNNFSSIPDLQTHDQGRVWQFQNSIFEGPDTGAIQLLDSVEYYKNIKDAVSSKSRAGFPTTITDYWGRALSYQLIDAENGGPSYTWSSIGASSGFQNADMPMPVLVADGRYPGQLIIPRNATIYEFNPWEFGTFDPTVYGFAPIEFLGSKFVGGSLPQNESCINGLDNAGFVMGTSSSLFNQFFLKVNDTALPSFIKDAARSILEEIGENNDDIARYKPNPFYQFHNNSSPVADRKALDLVDGGEDLENIPLHPLIQPERHVDVIFAVDSSADTDNNWPNGTALVATYDRSQNATGIANGTAFPAIPGQNTFVNKGLNTRPTFFGCDSKNISGTAPLIVYLPNYPYIAMSNLSTFDPSYNLTERDAVILNGYDVVTMANATRDTNWPTCVGCAILSRSFDRTNTTVPEACTKCFDDYCWDGSTDTSNPPPYAPDAVLAQMDLSSAPGAGIPSLLTILVAAGAAFLVMA